MKQLNLLQSFNLENGLTQKNSEVIYKDSIYLNCDTDKKKKAIRGKLRKNLDNFLDTFSQIKTDKTKLTEFKKIWLDYAKETYLNINIIYSGNDKEKAQICNDFTKSMQSLEETKKVTNRPKKVINKPIEK